MSAYHAARVDALRAELAQLVERVSAHATDGDAGSLARVAVLAHEVERALDELAVALLEMPEHRRAGDACARCKGPGPLVACACACSWRVEGQGGAPGTREGFLREALCADCVSDLVRVVGVDAPSRALRDASGGERVESC